MSNPETRPPAFLRDKHVVLLQMLRYAVAGGVITGLVTLSYWVGATLLHLDPNFSLAVVFLFFSLVSYVVHGAFSFRDHGARDRQSLRAGRFILVNLLGFALNSLFVWLLVKRLHGPTWWPMPAMMTITPLLTFSLHRRWVYA